MTYSHIARAVFDRPWAIMPKTMQAIVEVLDLRLSGGRFDEDELRARLAAAAQSAGPRGGAQSGQIAVLPVYGVLSHRMNMMSEMSGGTSVSQLRGAFRQALADPAVTGIVFDVDSPGGVMDGIPELAAEIRAARGQKPMVAVSDTLNGSAAYWLSAQADEVIVSPSSLTGSIGVFMPHVDQSGMDEQAGIKVTYIHAGKRKVDGNPHEPLGDEARAYIQGLVDDAYAMFVSDVAKGRGVSASIVRGESFGEGRVLTPANAVKAGLADRIGTLEDAIGRVARGKVGMRAEVSGWSVAASDFLEGPTAETETATSPVEATVETEQAPESGPNGAYRIALAKARARSRKPLATR